jgi:hypothetical protein
VTGAEAIDALSARVRDTGNTAHPRATLATLLTHAQRALNLHLRARRSTATVSLEPGRTLYYLADIADDIARVERVIVNDRTLAEVAWTHLVYNNAEWYRADASEPATWARVGTTILAVTPAPWSTLEGSVVYTVIPPDVADDATELTLPDEHNALLLDFAEGLTMLRARQFAAMNGAMTRLAMMLPQRPGAGVPRAAVNV